MTPDQIAAWAAAGESETLEFKKSTAEKDRACRTLCAFANGLGGRLLFGVTPSGKLTGQTVADHTLEELAQEFQGFEPPLFPLVERVGIGAEREVLVLTVARVARAPVAFRGVAYERVLNTTRSRRGAVLQGRGATAGLPAIAAQGGALQGCKPRRVSRQPAVPR